MSAFREAPRSYQTKGTRTRIRRSTQLDGVYRLPWILEYRDGGDWERFGWYNTTASAEWVAHTVFGGPRPGPEA